MEMYYTFEFKFKKPGHYDEDHGYETVQICERNYSLARIKFNDLREEWFRHEPAAIQAKSLEYFAPPIYSVVYNKDDHDYYGIHYGTPEQYKEMISKLREALGIV